jgi:FkbM family methyltransferase
MKEITQQNLALKIIEHIVRSNFYMFIFFRYITNKFFFKYIYESDFKILKYLKKTEFFKKNKKKIILDIGANDGISIKAIKNFVKDITICSIEPGKENFKKLKILKKKYKNLKIINCAVSNKKGKGKKTLFQPFYKNFHLSPFDSLSIKDVYKSMNFSLFIKNIKKKIHIEKSYAATNIVDNLNLKPCFVKIDIQGHEYNCLLGSLKTIKKNLPIIMMEYDLKENKKIYKVLKRINYKKFFFRSKNGFLKEHKNERIFNIFYIHKKTLKEINSEIKIEYNDNNKT